MNLLVPNALRFQEAAIGSGGPALVVITLPMAECCKYPSSLPGRVIEMLSGFPPFGRALNIAFKTIFGRNR